MPIPPTSQIMPTSSIFPRNLPERSSTMLLFASPLLSLCIVSLLPPDEKFGCRQLAKGRADLSNPLCCRGKERVGRDQSGTHDGSPSRFTVGSEGERTSV